MFEAEPETTRVDALRGGITSGLDSVSVFVRVILKYEFVAFRKFQKAPALDVAVVAGSVTALNPEFVR